MTQSLELLLDDVTEAAVTEHWNTLSAAGLPSMADHTGASNRPHVTLGVAEQIPDDVERSLDALAADLPIGLTLGAPLVFGRGRQRILCRLVVPDEPLLRLHAHAADLLRDLPAVAHLRPGAWTPHVTLARRLPVEQLPRALDSLGDLQERPGRAVAVRRWDSDARRTWLLG